MTSPMPHKHSLVGTPDNSNGVDWTSIGLSFSVSLCPCREKTLRTADPVICSKPKRPESPLKSSDDKTVISSQLQWNTKNNMFFYIELETLNRKISSHPTLILMNALLQMQKQHFKHKGLHSLCLGFMSLKSTFGTKGVGRPQLWPAVIKLFEDGDKRHSTYPICTQHNTFNLPLSACDALVLHKIPPSHGLLLVNNSSPSMLSESDNRIDSLPWLLFYNLSSDVDCRTKTGKWRL